MSAFSFDLSDFVFVWLALLYEALPFVVVGALLSGLVERCLSEETVARFFPNNRVLGIGASACMGMVFPMCECGVVPVVRRLVLKGVPVSCAVAYMLASPIVNPLVILSTLVAYRRGDAWTVAGLRVGLGYAVAVTVAFVVWKLGERNVLLPRVGNRNNHPDREHDPDHARDCDHDHQHDHDHHDGHGNHQHAQRGSVVGDILLHASHDFMIIGASLIVGAGLAALINSGFSRSAMEPFAENPFTAVGGMSVLAVALNLCSEADAFVAASFYAFPLAAQLAFLVLGPMVDIKLLAMYTTVFRPKAIVLISGLVTLLVFALCVSGYYWMPVSAGAGM